MDKEKFYGQMDLHMKVSFKMINFMGKENIYGAMTIYMKGIGLMEIWKDMVYILKMAKNMKDNLKKILFMDMESKNIVITQYIKENGKMD